MSKRRQWLNAVRAAVTWLSTGLSVLVLAAIFVFIVSRGWSTLSVDLLTSDYHPQNDLIRVNNGQAGAFQRPKGLDPRAYYSPKFGIALRDDVDSHKARVMTLVYIDPHSPLRHAERGGGAATRGTAVTVTRGASVRRIDYIDAHDKTKHAAGFMGGQSTAEHTIQRLETKASAVVGMFYQSQGGGIRGSLMATLMLIGLTIVVALPIGVAAAVYLHELAPKTKLTATCRALIEMLAGVPSIVFGLMGMTMLFSITTLFGITTQSVLLGALTMAVILFPVVIRQTEEALIVVPDSLRMASLSLGATRTQTIFKVILPNALPGILTATLLSISRVIGESAALIYTMGTAINDKPEVGRGATSLAVQIWTVMTGEQPNFELASAISIVILAMVLILNIIVKIITLRLNRKWRPT